MLESQTAKNKDIQYNTIKPTFLFWNIMKIDIHGAILQTDEYKILLQYNFSEPMEVKWAMVLWEGDGRK